MNHFRFRLGLDYALGHEYALVDRVLFPETTSRLGEFCNGLEYGPCRQTPIWQEFEQCGFVDRDWSEEIDWLVRETEEVVLSLARAKVRHGLMRWRVNDISIQRYARCDTGIAWHRDYASDKHLVVVYTVRGVAQLNIETIEGSKRELLARSGSVLMLTGPDPLTGDDPRLRHQVGPPLTDEPRISIALRMHVAGDE